MKGQLNFEYAFKRILNVWVDIIVIAS